MHAVANQGRRGSEYIHVKGIRFRAPHGTRVKPGTKLEVVAIRKGSVMVKTGSSTRGSTPGGSKAPTERWFRVSPLKGAQARKSSNRRSARSKRSR